MLPAVAAAPAVLAAPANASTLDAAHVTSPSAKYRGLWIHPERYFTTSDAKEGRAQVRAMVARYADAGFNTLLPWTVSGYLVAVEDARQRDKHPSASWDMLGVIVEEAQQASMRVDMWYSYTEYRGPASPEFDPKYGGDPSWRALNEDKIRLNKDEADGAWNVCPQHAGARQWQYALLMRALKRYPALRGLHIEEPGYDTKAYCLCALCTRLFEEVHNKPLLDNLQSQPAQDLKTIGNSAFAWEMREQLRAGAPGIIYSMNGGHDWRHDRLRGRDWGRWAISGWLDYFVPQVYEESVEAFADHLHVTVKDIGFACPVYAGIAIDWSEGKNNIDMVVRQIHASREQDVQGLVLFHGAAFSDADLKALKQGPFRG